MIRLKAVDLSFGEQKVLRGLTLSVAAREHIAILGPSGCGKTSLLRVIAELQKPDSGQVCVNSKKLSYMFQEQRLLSWRTAAENIALVLDDAEEGIDTAKKWLDRIELGDACDKYPRELSGGMRQRVALARTLAADAELILLDEPFKAMDEELRSRMMELVKVSTKESTLLLVTHDPEEARALGCSIINFEDINNVK